MAAEIERRTHDTGGPIAVYRRSGFATTYHSADCTFIKEQKLETIPADIADIAHKVLTPCTVCKPATPTVMAAMGNFLRNEKAAEDAKPKAKISEAQARSWAAAAAARAKGSDEVFVEEFRALVRATAPKYLADDSFRFLRIIGGDDLDVYLIGPLASFEISASETVRKREPIATASWPRGVAIVVSPKTINADDIEQIIVERAGAKAAPLLSLLTPQVLTTRMGVQKVLRSGRVYYPAATFDAGAEVVITVIPAVGHNVSLTLDSDDLKKIL